MRKSDYKSPKVKEIDLSIRRSVCQTVSPIDEEMEYAINNDIDGNDDF